MEIASFAVNRCNLRQKIAKTICTQRYVLRLARLQLTNNIFSEACMVWSLWWNYIFCFSIGSWNKECIKLTTTYLSFSEKSNSDQRDIEILQLKTKQNFHENFKGLPRNLTLNAFFFLCIFLQGPVLVWFVQNSVTLTLIRDVKPVVFNFH